MSRKEELARLLEDFKENDANLEESINRKGEYKYLLLLHLLIDVLDLDIKDIDSTTLVETYKFFIRLRRFLFKWINQIEDYMTSLIDINKVRDINKILLQKTFYAKKIYFLRKGYFSCFIKKHGLLKKFADFDDYESKLDSIIQLRNWISHLDLFYLNFSRNDNKYYTLYDYIKNLKFFIWKECATGDAKNKWKSIDNQLKAILENKKDNIITPDHIRLFKKILEFDFTDCNLFID